MALLPAESCDLNALAIGSFTIPSLFTLLRNALARNVPPIVLLKTGFLGYWSENVSHACVLVGLTDNAAFMHDPWLTYGPVEVTLTEFMAAWTELDYLAAIISPAR